MKWNVRKTGPLAPVPPLPDRYVLTDRQGVVVHDVDLRLARKYGRK